MMNYLTAKITDFDVFAHEPESSLLYNMKKQYPTLYGGCLTVMYNMQLAVIWYLQLYAMFKYQNNYASQNFSAADFKAVYKVTDLNSFPVYSILHEGKVLERYHKTKCQEYEGDCLKYT